MTPGNSYIGVQINNYQITKELASGGFGSVFLAQHNKLNRVVAIKLLHSAHLNSQQQQDQFMQEALLLDKAKHPYALPILDVGIYNNIPYIIMEYAFGGSLRDRLNRQHFQLLSPQETLSILSQVGQALQHAHEQNIIHRDIKPENILFNAKGETLLADFGIATALSTASMKYTTSLIGTPPYMAPEQFKGIISKESDQYALGCVAYELAAGRIPFQAPDMISMAFLHATENATPPSQLNPTIPSYVEQAILKAMAKQRADRYADVHAFIQALQTPSQPHVQSPNAHIPASIAPISQKTIKQWLDEGLAHLQAKRYKEALGAYEQAILLEPMRTKAHIGRGNALYGLRRYDDALRSYEQAERLGFDPKDDAQYHNGKGDVLHALQRYEEALHYYEQAISIDNNCAPAYNSIGNIRRMYSSRITDNRSWDQIQFSQTQLGLALEAYDAAVKIDGNFAIAHYSRGIILYAQNRYPEALAAFQQTIRLDPHDANAYNSMGITLVQLGIMNEALSAFQQAVRLNPSFADAHQNMGNAFQQLGMLDESRKAYETAKNLRKPAPVVSPQQQSATQPKKKRWFS